ncbi:hypothetical protein C0165_02980 [Moraxella catarrhalis]|nr:hypothetical protein [Moraxella catarrhalis]
MINRHITQPIHIALSLMIYKYTKADSHFMIQYKFIYQAYISVKNLSCLVVFMIFWLLVCDFYSSI